MMQARKRASLVFLSWNGTVNALVGGGGGHGGIGVGVGGGFGCGGGRKEKNHQNQ